MTARQSQHDATAAIDESYASLLSIPHDQYRVTCIEQVELGAATNAFCVTVGMDNFHSEAGNTAHNPRSTGQLTSCSHVTLVS